MRPSVEKLGQLGGGDKAPVILAFFIAMGVIALVLWANRDEREINAERGTN